MDEFKTIKKDEYVAEIEEKKSRFIGSAFYVQNEEEIKEILENIRKSNRGANHNCFAYRYLNDGQLIERSSDDGEPSGTAGVQILNNIKGEELYNVLVVVTRYFGGTLLGTGGLSKAYSEATKNVLEKSVKVNKAIGYEIEVEIEYNALRAI